MADQQQVNMLMNGVEAWNRWRQEQPELQIDLRDATLKNLYLRGIDLDRARLSGADLSGTDLKRARLSGADLSETNLSNADLSETALTRGNLSYAMLKGADLRQADLSDAYLKGAHLNGADLNEANLRGADLSWANCNGSNLSEADLREADLSYTSMSGATLSGADLSGCTLYAFSAWDAQLEDTIQTNLRITSYDEPAVIVENVKIAQLIALLLSSREVHDILGSIQKRIVLVLGCLLPERTAFFDALTVELIRQGYTPVVCAIEKPTCRNFGSILTTLVHISRFVLLDLTDTHTLASSLHILASDPSVPIQPLLLATQADTGAASDFEPCEWVLPLAVYEDEHSLIANLHNDITGPVDKQARALALQKALKLIEQ